MTTLVELIEKAISQKTYNKNNKELLIWCPVCNKNKSNKKISININPRSHRFGKWHCWVCEDSHKVRGSNVESLLRFFKSDKSYIDMVSDFIPKSSVSKVIKTNEYKVPDLKLPKNLFI